MSEKANKPLQNSGLCAWQLRGLSHEPGDYPCSRTVVYDGHPTQEEQGAEVVSREVRCSKILRVTNQVLEGDSAALSRMAGKEMVTYKSDLVPNPQANPVDAAIAGYACLEPQPDFPYLHISWMAQQRQNR